jgi:uncharacterized protein
MHACPAPWSRRRFLARVGAAAAVAAGGAGAAAANALEPRRSVAPGAPSAGAIRVALVTDLHAPHYWFGFDELASVVSAFDPHLVAVAGDSLNRRGDEALVRACERLPARVASFASLGNWEYQSGCDRALLRREYERAGVRLLVNESATVDVGGRRVHVAGLDDLLRGRPSLGVLRPAGPRPELALVLAHCPALFDPIASASGGGAPVVTLSGHTHGGQIAPFGHALITPSGSGRYVKGWYAAPGGRHHLYVSRGLGNSDVPFRIGSPPELALLEI